MIIHPYFRILVRNSRLYHFRSVGSSADNAFRYPIVPRCSWETTVASETACPTTRYKIFGWEVDVFSTIRVNTNTVRHWFYGSKRLWTNNYILLNINRKTSNEITESTDPTRPARSLVPNFFNGRAVGPLLSGVEILRQFYHRVRVRRQLFQFRINSVIFVHAHQTSEVVKRRALVEIATSLKYAKDNYLIKCAFNQWRHSYRPWTLYWIDVVDKLIRQWIQGCERIGIAATEMEDQKAEYDWLEHFERKKCPFDGNCNNNIIMMCANELRTSELWISH